ncbi:putative chromosome-partitioning protein ParB [Clostridium liquoris]|jgi:ParB family chromosome partitioning protein|uniref:Putative chromosome-partitioning protein ParB n=1 Tax=Clostridium liquoris TaxID=1289519 RepID=A0A2T0B979_9CLOT|nr:ParB/RepB/Spo0J family partition protein [Clostridium liquoris]PRR80347.1 putative chromosome-partitioning protein ParB [Clostridium liquoris]
MSKKSGLGKGLGALIPEEINEDVPNDNNINKLSMALIKPNSGQPRKRFDEEAIIQLSQSIKEHGLIQPIIVKEDNSVYTIVAGERRWRAAKLAGLKDIPAIIMDLSDKDVLEISLIENIQRQDLNPIEEAKAYKKLLDDFKLTQEDLSKRIGKSRTAIANCLRLLNLDKRVQDYLIDGVISEGHGRAILSLTDNELQYKVSQTVIDENLSVRETEKLIRELSNTKSHNKKKENKSNNPYYMDLKNRLEELFGTKVYLNTKKNKGKIEIEYYSEEDLQRILDILKL